MKYLNIISLTILIFYAMGGSFFEQPKETPIGIAYQYDVLKHYTQANETLYTLEIRSEIFGDVSEPNLNEEDCTYKSDSVGMFFDDYAKNNDTEEAWNFTIECVKQEGKEHEV